MKTPKNLFLAYILKKLQPHGPITARAMFGGYGIYWDKIIFASIYANTLYFRADEYTINDFAPYNARPFVYEGTGKTLVLPYLTLPKEILENHTELPIWIQKAYQASLRHKKRKK